MTTPEQLAIHMFVHGNEQPIKDHNALVAIQQLMDGTTWDAETLDQIAAILRAAGYRINDAGE